MWQAVVGDSLKKQLEKTEQTEEKPTHERVEGLFGIGGEPGNGGHGGGGPANLTSWEGIVAAACFAEGTPVLMADGRRQTIETVKVDDRVMSVDGSPATVSRTTVRESNHWREIRYQVVGGKQSSDHIRRLRTTDEHYFWAVDREWTLAANLVAGDTLILSGGELGKVVSNKRFNVPLKVYNFDVEGTKSYFANDTLVYQECGGPDRDDRVTAWLRDLLEDWGKPRSLLSLPGGDPPGSELIIPRAKPAIEGTRQRRPL